jgi:DNA-binding PadR family transcriptional regulator
MNDLILLITLLDGPKHGYSLKQRAGLIYGETARHNNVIYPLLKMFLRNGWVQQSLSPGDRGQQRKEYSITPEGRDYLLKRLEDFDQQRAMDDESFLLRVSMFSLLTREAQAKILNLRKGHLQTQLARVRKLQDDSSIQLYGRIVLERAIQLTENELNWIAGVETYSTAKETNSYEV